jgi:hypothetical protein
LSWHEISSNVDINSILRIRRLQENKYRKKYNRNSQIGETNNKKERNRNETQTKKGWEVGRDETVYHMKRRK